MRGQPPLCVLSALSFGTLVAARGNDTDASILHGWQSGPNTRGTSDILWSCLSTILLCTWTALHLNIPAPGESPWAYNLRKARWMVQTLYMPEVIVWLACGQCYEAKLSVKHFKDIGHTNWTIKHGFYANMGGFRLKVPNLPEFPITARHIHHLVQNNYITMPEITMEEVWDKSKADYLTKTLVCIQICWQIVQVVGRAVQHLPTTTLELTSLTYVLCALATYYLWMNKPLDIETSTTITMNIPIDVLWAAANDPKAAAAWEQTPLDFIDNLAPCWWINAQKYLPFRLDPPERPLQRFTNDKFPVVGIGFDIFLCAFVAFGFAGLHIAAWHFHFPSTTERTLWRVACMLMCGTMVVIFIVDGIVDWQRRERGKALKAVLFRLRGDNEGQDIELQRPTREEAMAKPDFIPYWEFVVFMLVTVAYGSARIYFLVEVFLGLRALPVGALTTVDWANFLPHI